MGKSEHCCLFDSSKLIQLRIHFVTDATYIWTLKDYEIWSFPRKHIPGKWKSFSNSICFSLKISCCTHFSVKTDRQFCTYQKERSVVRRLRTNVQAGMHPNERQWHVRRNTFLFWVRVCLLLPGAHVVQMNRLSELRFAYSGFLIIWVGRLRKKLLTSCDYRERSPVQLPVTSLILSCYS